jgi:predicted ATPase
MTQGAARWRPGLCCVSVIDLTAALDALDEAVGAQLITAEGGDSFTFTHDKIREVLYEELNPIRRRRLHRLAAESLERRRNMGGASQYPAEKLTYHYIQAGDYEHGLIYAKQAAAEAERVFAFDEAIAAYGQARDCAEALGLIDEQVDQEKAIGRTYVWTLALRTTFYSPRR